MADPQKSKVLVKRTERFELSISDLKLSSLDDSATLMKATFGFNGKIVGEALLNIDEFLELADELRKLKDSRGK